MSDPVAPHQSDMPKQPDSHALLQSGSGKFLDRIGADFLFGLVVRAAAVTVLLMLAALLLVLWRSALPSIKQFGFSFLVTSDWRPNELERPLIGSNGKPVVDQDGEVQTQTIPPAFGAWPVIYGTVASSILALCFAVPLSFGTALFLVRIAPGKLIAPISFLVEFLAAIPSIAYGIWGLFVLCPFLQRVLEPFLAETLGKLTFLSWMFRQRSESGNWIPVALTGRDMFAGGLVLGIMILPIIIAVSRDILRAVPLAQIEGTVALGATWWESCKEMLKFSRSGLFGAVMLGLARAAGETMAVTMVIGNNDQIRASPFVAAQTMSSLLANEFSEATTDEHRAALIEVALILLVMSLIFNIVARYLVVGRGSRSAAAH
ncbi:MAG: phosphate ABC transporter permease subunit PstC [Planctomycetota bacterium]|nr:phosphate ABC transporter permease subunit PstC [Planctomycetota bacterium]